LRQAVFFGLRGRDRWDERQHQQGEHHASGRPRSWHVSSAVCTGLAISEHEGGTARTARVGSFLDGGGGVPVGGGGQITASCRCLTACDEAHFFSSGEMRSAAKRDGEAGEDEAQ